MMADDSNSAATEPKPETGWATPDEPTAPAQPAAEPDSAASDQKNLSLPSAQWLLPAVGGNIAGGVVMVTLLEYGQTVLSPSDEEKADAA